MDEGKIARLFKICAILVLLSGFLYPRSVVSKPVPNEKTLPVSLTSSFQDFRAACKAGETQRALTAIKRIEEWKLDKGFRNAPFLSETLVKTYEDSSLYRRNSFQQRLSVYEGIYRLSPDEPHYRWQYFKSYFYAHPFNIYYHLKNFRRIFPAVKTNLEWALDVGGEALLAFIAALFLTAFGMAVNFIIKYAFHLVFYLKQFVRVSIGNLMAILIILVIFFMPIYFNIGFYWLPFFWMILLWMFLTKWEKGVVWFLLIVLIILSFGVKQIGRFFMAGANHNTFLLYQANYTQVEPTGHERLKELVKNSKADADIFFTLGLLAKRRGEYKQAATYYQRALKVEPGFSECMNNLGNAYLLMKGSMTDAVSQARFWYKKAIEADPARAEFYYNLSKSFPLLHVEGMEYVVKARDLNPELIDLLTKRNSNHPNQRLVDCLLPSERLWHRAFMPGRLPKVMSTLFVRFFMNVPGGNIFVMPIVLLLLIALFSIIQRGIGTAVSCARCGQLFFKKTPLSFRQRLCQQCQVIQHRSAKADPDLVRKKEIEVEKYRRRRKVIGFTLGILPFGGGFMLKERIYTFLGMVLTFLFFWFLSYFLICHEVFTGLATLFFGYAGCSYFFMVIAVLIYLLSLAQMIHTFVKEGF